MKVLVLQFGQGAAIGYACGRCETETELATDVIQKCWNCDPTTWETTYIMTHHV
jgi:hypothetical protein